MSSNIGNERAYVKYMTRRYLVLSQVHNNHQFIVLDWRTLNGVARYLRNNIHLKLMRRPREDRRDLLKAAMEALETELGLEFKLNIAA